MKCISCGDRARWGFSGGKATHCKKCASDKMCDVYRKKCYCQKRRPDYGIEGGKATHCIDCYDKTTMIRLTKEKEKCEGCKDKIPSFGYEGGKKVRCASCKLEGMIRINLKNEKCDDCDTTAFWGFEGDKKPTKCATHRLEGMKDIKSYLCKCGKYPSFNYPSEKKAICCADCAEDGMINIKKNKCKECDTQAIFGYKGKIATHCFQHKKDDMLDLNHSSCECGSGLRKIFGNEKDGIPSGCSKCKKDDMINLQKYNLCIQCNEIGASFGYAEDNKVIFCANCKDDNSVDLKHKKCDDCDTICSFGFPDSEKPSKCSQHALDGMINLKSSKCHCGKIASFNYPNQSPATHCFNHKLDGMINITIKKCEKCGINNAYYGYEEENKLRFCSECQDDDCIYLCRSKCIVCNNVYGSYGYKGSKPTHCYKHKEAGMKNINDIMCVNCKDWIDARRAIKKYDYHCSRCFHFLYPDDPRSQSIPTNNMELKVRDFINKNFEGFSHDQILEYAPDCICAHRRRIDHRKLIGNTLLCIETDENQHKYYDNIDEEQRYHDLFTKFSCNYVFIRINPDGSFLDKTGKRIKPQIRTRLMRLGIEIKTQINRIQKGQNNKNGRLEVIKLFFDGNIRQQVL